MEFDESVEWGQPVDEGLVDGPIDIQALKAAVAEKGPIRLTYTDSGLSTVLSISPCVCGTVGCKKDVIAAAAFHGVNSFRSTIDPDVFVLFPSVTAFLDRFFHCPEEFFSSSGDEQMIELELYRKLGIDAFEFYAEPDFPENGLASTEEREWSGTGFWEAHSLVTLLRILHLKRSAQKWFAECEGDELDEVFRDWKDDRSDFIDYFSDTFDLGFLAGRLWSEYRAKKNLEELVKLGERSNAAQEKRTQASGKKSAARRTENLETLMQAIEGLTSVVGLISEDRIVAQALEIAREREVKMPKSKKTLDDYVTALRSEEPFKSRYDAVFRENP